MQFRIAGLLTLATLFCATSADAYFAIDMKFRPGTEPPPSETVETVTVDLFFSTDEPGMQQLSVGVVSDDAVTYDRDASLALPVIYPAPPAASGRPELRPATSCMRRSASNPWPCTRCRTHPSSGRTPSTAPTR
jgi:hypothetical protein